MKTQLHVVKRKGSDVYYFRARIPADLQSHFGKAEAWVSLHTRDIREANTHATIEQLKLDQRFATLRDSSLRATKAELERITLLWFLGLDCLETLPTDVQQIVDSELSKHGLNLDKNSEEYSTVYSLFSKALERLNSQPRAMPSAIPTKAPCATVSAPLPIHEDNLKHLLDYWIKQNKPSPRSIEAALFAVQQLDKVTENKPVSKLTKADLVNYKDKRLEKVSPATVEKDINLLGAIFNTAVNNAKLSNNPAEGVKAPTLKGGKKPRIAYELQDLQAIFSSPIYTDNHRPKGGAGEASFWLPLIALFSGARLTEIGQLLTEDVREEAGIRYLSITTESDDDDTESKTLKTAHSHRRVPIHPELVRCGFMEYVLSMKQEGHTRLFPFIKAAPHRPLTASFSQWFGNYKRKVLGINDSRKTFHSFRHTFKDACRVSGIHPEHHDKLTGHSSGSVGDSYGGEFYPLRPLAKAISGLSYEGLDLSHLYINQPNER